MLITGAGGFIGSHLVEEFVKAGYDVKAFVRYNSRNSWGWLEDTDVKDQIEVVAGDIRDYDSVEQALKGCEAVIHLAALIGIPYSYVSPLAYVRTNVEGTYNVLQCAMKASVKQVIVTSTSETYGTAQYVPIDEKHAAVGQSPYSATKIAADQLAISYFRSFSLPIKIVRPFNTFGPRQSARAVIPTIVTQALGGSYELNLGNLHPTRDLTYVKDTVKAFLAVFESDKAVGQALNIGMNQEISIRNLAEMIADIMETKVTFVRSEERIRPSGSEVERLRCDNSKIIALTSWKPAYDLRSGLLETVEWIKENQEYYKAHLYNV